MRYNVHTPCAFHSRIAKTLGVLVGAALVATLGLPSAVQAQTPAAPMVSAEMSGTDAATLCTTCRASTGPSATGIRPAEVDPINWTADRRR